MDDKNVQWIIVSEIDKSIHYILHAAFKDDHRVPGAVGSSCRRLGKLIRWKFQNIFDNK